MSIKILMPALSPTMTEGNLSKWLVKVGDQVNAGDVIAEIETDKATMEIESVDEGKVKELLFSNGEQNIPVNTPIAILLSSEENNQSKSSPQPTETRKKELKNKDSENQLNYKKLKKDTEDKNDKVNEITMREAIRDTIAEEMRINEKIFLLGEEVAQYQGAYKVTQGLLEEFTNNADKKKSFYIKLKNILYSNLNNRFKFIINILLNRRKNNMLLLATKGSRFYYDFLPIAKSLTAKKFRLLY